MESIRIEGLSKIYRKGLRRQKVSAVNDLSLAVADGEIFGFIGPNGAGKSTTIKILCDLIRPTMGRATIMDVDVRQPEARRYLGYLPENPSYYSFLTGQELLGFHGAIHAMQGGDIQARGEELLAMLNLAEAAQRPLRTYSKGMVQRLGIAAALIHDPRVVILDEPMSGLDPIGRKLVKDLMVHLRAQGKTVFFSTHILHDVEVICDRIGIITKGKLRYSGTLAEVVSESFSTYEVLFSDITPQQVEVLTGTGYRLKNLGDEVQVEVAKENLSSFLNSCVREDLIPHTIEPKRFSLEDFFLTFLSQ
jgi:ABC-2 type transport system ATP-binding protein